MWVEEEDIIVLKKLGLTSCQAKVYLALIDYGTSSVKKISHFSKIAREEIYRILPELHEMGLVEKILTRPTKFQAVPLDLTLHNLIDQRKNQTYTLEKQANEIIQNHKKTKLTKENLNQYQLVFVPSKQVLVQRLKDSVRKTKNSIYVLTSCNRLTSACDSLFEVLEIAWQRGVQGRAIINIPKNNQLAQIKKCWSEPSATLRFIPEIPRTVIAIYDKKEVYIFTEPKANLTESPALWSNSPSIIALTEDFFEVVWGTSMQHPEYNLDTLLTHNDG